MNSPGKTEDLGRARNPFVGPRPFSEAEESLFFGRAREIADLRALVTAHRAVLVYAPSGAGKSSLINAGLIPELKREGFEVLPVAYLGSRIPDTDSSLTGNVFADNAIASWRGDDEVFKDAESIAAFLGSRPREKDADGFLPPRLVVFDQFEELFTTHTEHWAARAGFFEQIRKALDDDPLLRVVFAIREDYLARLDPLSKHFPNRLRFRYRLELLREAAAVSAVREPFAKSGRAIDAEAAEGLVNRLLQTRVESEQGEPRVVRGEFVEPVQLQVVCQRLWAELPAGETRITEERVAQLGPLHEILGRFYVEGLRHAAARTRVSEKRLRSAFENSFITSAGTRGFVHREKDVTAGIPNDALAMLEDRRLLRSEWRAGAQWYEIPHDSLVEPIRRSNEAWRRDRQLRLRRLAFSSLGGLVAAAIGLLSVTTVFLPSTRQPPPAKAVTIQIVEIESTEPLIVSFVVEGAPGEPTHEVPFTISLSDEDGVLLGSFPVGPYTVEGDGSVAISVPTDWFFNTPGLYTVKVFADLEDGSVVRDSFAFQISPRLALDLDAWIESPRVVGTDPFTAEFRIANQAVDTPVLVEGVLRVADVDGEVVREFPIHSVTLDLGEATAVRVETDWSPNPGLYTVEPVLDIGDLGVASRSLAFEVAESFEPPDLNDWVWGIEVVSLSPFEVSFQFQNGGETRLENVKAAVAIQDRLGKTIETITVTPFSVAPGERTPVVARSRWDFQVAGIYLVEIWFDLGELGLYSVVDESFAFQILPVQLPLDGRVPLPGEGIYFVEQEPANWGLDRIGAREAWTLSHGDSDVVVAVIDAGIDSTIPQLAEALWTNPREIADNGIDDDRNGYVDDVHGWDFQDDDNSSLVGSSLHEHGTFVAGIIAARPGEQPMVGVAPGVSLMDVRILDSSNSFRASDWEALTAAIDYAVDNGANVINLGIFASGRPPAAFEEALRRAVDRGVTVVGMAGNLEREGIMYPGRYESVLAVGATTSLDELGSFSSWGPGVALCAPGRAITSFTVGGRLTDLSGTSFAAAHVSGVVALMLSLRPDLSPSETTAILEETAKDLGEPGYDEVYGYGLVDAYRAVSGLAP